MTTKITEAIKYREQGKTFKEIAVLVGCSEGYLRKRLAGVPKGVESYRGEVISGLEELGQLVGKLLKTVRGNE